MENDMSVFKSYLRSLMRDLKDLQEAIKKKDMEKAEELIKNLIEDTQKDIED
jgi:DNA-binding GntR family transcriptional regulator